MHVLINALAATGGGGVTYIQNLLPELGRVAPQYEFTLLTAPWQTFWRFDLPPNCYLLTAPLPSRRNLSLRMIWEQTGLPGLLRREKADLLYSVSDTTTLLAPCPVVLAIRNPNPYMANKRRYGIRYLARNLTLKVLTWASARRAQAIIFVSYYSRDEVTIQLSIPPSKTRVVYHGIGSLFLNQAPFPTGIGAQASCLPFGRKRPYVLSVSNITEHKNYPFLVRSFVRLQRTTGLDYDLVIAGQHIYQPHVAEMQRTATEAGLADHLHLIGHVPHADLPGLYRRAALFVLPSVLETFGHPLVEAMASGVPVVASNRTAIPEICGDAALYFDPMDVEGAAQKMAWALNDLALRERLVAHGRARAAVFSWERTARETVAVLEAAMVGAER